MAKHGDNLQYEPASRVCPLCFRPRIEHKNRCLSEEEKGSHRGNLYKCCHCAASKLSAKKFFVHLENHVSVLVAPTGALYVTMQTHALLFSLSPMLKYQWISTVLQLKPNYAMQSNWFIDVLSNGQYIQRASRRYYDSNSVCQVSKKHMCTTCGKGYSYKHLLNEHTWKEHGEGQHIR